MGVRDKVLDAIREQVRKGRLKFRNPDRNSLVVVTRAEGYDFKLDAEVWKLSGNRSKARDLKCPKCGHQVVMSENLWGRLQAGEFLAEQVRCSECMKL